MKKVIFLFSFAALMVAGMTSCGSSSKPADAKVVYTCPMHPEVQGDKPDQCPKCGMDLVVKK